METSTAGQVAAEDPFGGGGVFLEMTATAPDILDTMERVLGPGIQAIAWPMRGAWVDTSAAGFSAEYITARWGSAL
jgi:hypothetical protein